MDGPNRRSTPWVLFFIVLLAPAALTTVAARAKSDFAAGVMVVGSVIAGLICAWLIPLVRERNPLARFVIRAALAVAFGFLSLVLSFAGCAMMQGS